MLEGIVDGLLKFPEIRNAVFAPDIGPFFARGNTICFENTTLLQQPGEPDSKVDEFVTIHSIRGNMGTTVDGARLAPLAANLLNKMRDKVQKASRPRRRKA